MAEVFAWPEGELHLWTGSSTASGNPIAYVNNMTVTLTVRWQSDAAVDGTYRQHSTEKRADFSFGIDYLYGDGLVALFNAQTACHAKFTHKNTLASAGIILYSGRINTLALAGNEAAVFNETLNGFAHLWTGF